MGSERYVVLALAHPRAEWFTEVARWATAGVVPIELVKCMAPAELTARLETERRFSALLVDASAARLDRDLIELARARNAAIIVVGSSATEWRAIGAAAALPSTFDRAALLDVLATHATLVSDVEAATGKPPPPAPTMPWRGRLIAVTGPGGAGTSTAAMALAQGLADDVRHAAMVLLADLALDADLAMYHDVGDIVPGLSELVEAHRSCRMQPSQVRDLTFEITLRRYRLLLGLRQHRDWAALRPRAVEASIESLRAAFHFVVADVDADLEGDAETGSAEVEERNSLARSAARAADLVVVVGAPGLKGVFGLQRAIRHLRAFGVENARLLPAVNLMPRQGRARAELQRALAVLTEPLAAEAVSLPLRRDLDDIHREAARLPAALTTPLVEAVLSALDTVEPRQVAAVLPEPIAPGSLGSWTGNEAAS